jgi:osmotically-inducible protein OsmY
MSRNRARDIRSNDQKLGRRVADALASRHFPAFRTLAIGVEKGAVTLSGTVRSFHERQVAVSMSQQVLGVVSLMDQIEVEC